MSEPAHLADQLRSFFDASGQHWSTSFLRTIDGLDAEGAAQKAEGRAEQRLVDREARLSVAVEARRLTFRVIQTLRSEPCALESARVRRRT